MKVYEDNCICLNCEFFEHDCFTYEEYGDCVEWCTNKDDFITEGFNENDEIVGCSGFSKEL